MYKEVHRGDIWFLDWSSGRGSEQTGMRPAVIIQTDAANRNPHYPNTIVLTISTKGKAVPFHVSVKPSEENGLKETSFVKCEQILTISKVRLIRAWDVLKTNDWKRWRQQFAVCWKSKVK
ncbi:MAG: growth inhibitor PemK [Syntrophus sp. (in: bacteria)]|nr:growth inhibitor PemK [Syntrophus sp. (in: bacteria)]